MRLFVVHFCNHELCTHQLHSSYFYTTDSATYDDVINMMYSFDQGDADVGTASHPVQIYHWQDVDPQHYDCLYFSDDEALQDVSLLEFMREHWLYSHTRLDDEPETMSAHNRELVLEGIRQVEAGEVVTDAEVEQTLRKYLLTAQTAENKI